MYNLNIGICKHVVNIYNIDGNNNGLERKKQVVPENAFRLDLYVTHFKFDFLIINYTLFGEEVKIVVVGLPL